MKEKVELKVFIEDETNKTADMGACLTEEEAIQVASKKGIIVAYR
ncbi:MAG: hypothetical protein Q8R00_04725 [Candidatus Nanoarchaeia archaeon]|nr:hypothetical protein [Candidatus Nanoarchaeia archaeon]